jgi:hypothetical protein
MKILNGMRMTHFLAYPCSLCKESLTSFEIRDEKMRKKFFFLSDCRLKNMVMCVRLQDRHEKRKERTHEYIHNFDISREKELRTQHTVAAEKKVHTRLQSYYTLFIDLVCFDSSL